MNNRYVILDLETTVTEYYGRKGNPWFNDIVAIGIKKKDKNVYSYYKEQDWNSVLEEEFKNIDVMVAHNSKFENLHLWKYKAFQNWLLGGGKVWCTQLAEYILEGQQSKYAALRTIAVNKYNCPEREKFMEKFWKKGIDTDKIPQELVQKDVENDVLDTEQVYLKQVQIAEKQAQLYLIETQMDALLATSEMEYNGLFIDKQILIKNKQNLQNELDLAKKDLMKIVNRYWR